MGTRRFAPAVFLVTAVCALLASPPAHADFIDHFATTEDVGRAKVPAFGSARVLVLTIEVDGFDPLDMEAIEAYFDPNAPAGQPSFTDYFKRMSQGAYEPVADVIEPIRFEGCPLPEDYFGFEDCFIPRNGGGGAEALDTLEVGLGLLEEIIERVDEERGVDFSLYDTNGPDGQPDGWIDGVLLLHNINFGGIALPVFFVRRDGPIIVDETQINIVGIAESPNVALHEFGHLLGWADLYDESGKTQGLQYSSMGSWGYETPPPALDAFSRIAVGWAEPQVVKVGQSLTDVRLPPVADSGAILQLGEGDEYFLVENRGAVSGDYIDAGIDGRGLAVYHVNKARLPNPQEGGWPLRLLNCLNCEPWEPFLMNEQADGKFNLQSQLGRRNDDDDLFKDADDKLVPNTINFLPLDENNKAYSSNTYNGAVTGVSLTNVRVQGDDILVDVSVEEPCSIVSCNSGKVCVEGRCVEGDDVPDDNPDDDTPDDETPEETASASSGGGCATSPTQSGGAATLFMLLLLGLALRRKN